MLDKKNEEQYESDEKKKEKMKAIKFKKRVIAEILVGVFLILFVWGYKNETLIRATHKNYTERIYFKLATGQANRQEINEALLEAVYYNDLKMTKTLVMAGADIDYCGEDDFAHPLLQAAVYNYVEIAKYLLDKGADPHITLPRNTFTPLAYAIMEGNVAVAKLLIEREKDINYKDSNGDTALMYAVETEKFNKEICELLLSKGADINATDGNGGSTILINITNSIENHEDKARFLLDHGANVNASNSVGTTPLLQAASVGNLNLVKLYIERGADIFVINTWNQSALDLATMMEPHNEVIAYLKEKGLK